MQKWLISADTKKWNHPALFAECGYIYWQKKLSYEIGDIVYIYCKVPIGKIMFKTYVEEISSNEISDEDWVKLHLIEYVDNDDLSLKKLEDNGLKIAPMKGMRLKGQLEKYIDKYFELDSKIENQNPRMWFINAGEKGAKFNTFIKHNFVGIGNPIVDLTAKSRDELELVCKQGEGDVGNCLYKVDAFVNQIKFGDYIITKDNSNKKYYIGRCISDYYYSEEKDDSGVDIPYNHCRDVVWLDVSINKDDLSEENINYIDFKKSVQEIKNNNAKEEILNFYNCNCFLSKEKRNLIYFGAPGTGKSYLLNEHKDGFLKKYVDDIENHYERVTFHPDYTYSNFVGAYKPVPQKQWTYKPIPERDTVNYKPVSEHIITYKYVPGPFMRTLVNAMNNPYEPFILIIEEINRANVAAVFGEVFQLLDRDKVLGNSEYSINASEDMRKYVGNELDIQDVQEYRFCTIKKHLNLLFGENFDKISIPSNMFIWATMNSADQGVFPMDTAFKRRWDFEYLNINNNEHKIKPLKVNLNGKEISWNKLRKAINQELVQEYNINEDKLIGPFFAFKEYIKENEKSIEISPEKFKEIFENKIIMYLFEDVARSRRNELFEGVEKNTNLTYSQICQKFEEIGIDIFCDNVLKNYQNIED